MTSSLSCKDLGVKCSFEARSESKEQVKSALLDHAQKYHKDILDGMSEKQKEDMMAMMDKKLR
jgi:predicted small metal-binding protein